MCSPALLPDLFDEVFSYNLAIHICHLVNVEKHFTQVHFTTHIFRGVEEFFLSFSLITVYATVLYIMYIVYYTLYLYRRRVPV